MGDTEPACEGWLLSRTVSSQHLPLPASSLSLFTTFTIGLSGTLIFNVPLLTTFKTHSFFRWKKKISHTYRHRKEV